MYVALTIRLEYKIKLIYIKFLVRFKLRKSFKEWRLYQLSKLQQVNMKLNYYSSCFNNYTKQFYENHEKN